MIVGSNILAGASGQGGYFLNRSVRFRSSAQAYFSRTPAASGNTQIFTWNYWIKRGQLSAYQDMYFTNAGGGTFAAISWTANNTISITSVNSSVAQCELITSAVYRDCSSWYMLTFAVDTTQATASNRVKIYVNGVQVTAFATATYPAQNYNFQMNNTLVQNIGRPSSFPSDFYMAEVNFIDGQALTPTSFGEFNPITGVWQPKKYGGTYGTQGYYLNFNDNSAATAAAIGKDNSGNGNNWTPNNISVTAGATYDSMTDVPTLTSVTQANYSVMSPVTGTTNLSNGNLYLTGAGAYRGGYGSIALPSTGKWYWEGLFIQANNNLGFGLAVINPQLPITPLTGTGAIGFNNAGQWWVESGSVTSSGNPGWTPTTVVGMRYDAATGEFSYSSNGSTWTTIVTGTARFTDGRTWVPACWAFATNDQITLNFGQRPFTYTPPTGFVALNTYNLPTPTISNGANQMNAIPNSGTGTTRTDVVAFQPDFVWTKTRNTATNGFNIVQDSVRGAGNRLITDGTFAEAYDVNYGSFNSTGFTFGSNLNVNTNGNSYIDWFWKAGGAAVTNTFGSISSQVSANPTAGFSIVTYTGNSTANATVGHGLGITPRFFVVKVRSTTGEWLAYHVSTGKDGFMQLQSTAAFSSSANYWGTTGPTSTTIQLNGGGGVNNNGSTYVVYCFSEIAGYSKISNYTGNGSADGAFIYTGFRPRYVLIKSSGNASQWIVHDTSRDTYNTTNKTLYPNLSNAEATDNAFDILSNGFKIRTAGGFSVNDSGINYIYMAFAENPFKLALAR